jgi:ubiquinone/menaquinone biosynthesis C-methylase UbiE
LKNLLKNALRGILKQSNKIESLFDKDYMASDIHMSDKIEHHKWQRYLYDNFNKKGLRILEIGSREVTAESKARQEFSNAEYVGFDYYPGNNVDVVGDAHKISSYFKEGEQFDLIFSSACFEHFAMPWQVAKEMSKLCKVGGHIFVETHFSFSSHERPWHFYHFSDMALRSLFPRAMGFECIEAGVSNPIVGRFSKYASPYLRMKPVKAMYCHVEYLGKKVEEITDFDWDKVDLQQVVGETKYPEPHS